MEKVAIMQEQSIEIDSANTLANLCHVLGFLSIIASIAIWVLAQGDGSAESLAHAERFGIFVGLWAPTFFILSDRYSRS